MVVPTISKREKILFALTIIIAIGSLLYVFVAQPQFIKWQEASNQLRIKEERFKQTLGIIREKDRLEEEIRLFRGVAKAESGQEQLANLLKDIEDMAEGIDIERIEPLPIEEKGLYQTISLRMDIECNIKELVSFLYQVQNSPEMLNVERMSINSRKQNLEVQLLVSTIGFN